jgi:hypothetical protein
MADMPGANIFEILENVEKNLEKMTPAQRKALGKKLEADGTLAGYENLLQTMASDPRTQEAFEEVGVSLKGKKTITEKDVKKAAKHPKIKQNKGKLPKGAQKKMG